MPASPTTQPPHGPSAECVFLLFTCVMKLNLMAVNEGPISFIHSLRFYSVLRPQLCEVWIRGKSQTAWFMTLRAQGWG